MTDPDEPAHNALRSDDAATPQQHSFTTDTSGCWAPTGILQCQHWL